MREYNEYQDKTILVTGGAGCVGSNLTRKFADLGAEKVIILELVGGEVNILNAEKESVKLTKTGLFLCKEGEVVLTIDGNQYHMRRHSIIVYFSYSTLHILSHTPNLRGTLIGANLETIQPMLYNVTNFNALFVIKQVPLQTISASQYNTSLC